MDIIGLAQNDLLDHKDLCQEPLKLLLRDDVNDCLYKARYWYLLNVFEGFNLDMINYLAWSWREGKVMVGSFSFEITPTLMTNISNIVDDGVKIQKDKYPLATKLDFFTKGEELGWEGNSIMREYLPQPWLNIVGIMMNYFTLDTKTTWVRGYHLVILNNMHWGKKINIPHFLLNELESVIEDF